MLAKDRLFAAVGEGYVNDAQAMENGRKLLIRCLNTLIREQELAGPLVVTLLMGWNDTLQSHHFVPIYWRDVERALWLADPNLQVALGEK